MENIYIHRSEKLLPSEINDDVRLIVINAPAGFGKSVLISQFIEQAYKSKEKPIIIKIRRKEITTESLLSDIFEKTNQEENKSARFEENSYYKNKYQAENKITDDTKIWLIFDNFEKINTYESCKIIDNLLDITPHNIKALISSRLPLYGAISKKRASGNSIEISPLELAFSIHEIDELIKKYNSPLSSGLVIENTGGWPIISSSLIRENWLDSKSKTKKENLEISFYYDYIEYEIYKNLEKNEKQTLIDICHLDEFSLDQISSIRKSEYNQGKTIIIKLLGLITNTNHTKNYRLNPILKKFLISKEKSTNKNYRERIYRRTSLWFFKKNDLISAIKFSRKITNQKLTNKILYSFPSSFNIEKIGLEGIKKITDLFPENYTRNPLRIEILRSIYFMKSGKLKEGIKLLHDIQKKYKETKSNDPQKNITLQKDIEILKVFKYFYSGFMGNPEIIEYAKTTIESKNEKSNIKLFSLLIISCAYQQIGQTKLAERFLYKITNEYENQEIPDGLPFVKLYEGLLQTSQCLISLAENSHKTAIRQSLLTHGGSKTFHAIGNILLAENLYLKNSTDDAKKLLTESFHNSDLNESWFDVYFSYALTLSSIIFRSKGIKDSSQFLEQLEFFLESRGVSSMNKTLSAIHSLFLFRSGKDDLAIKTINSQNLQNYSASLKISDRPWRERKIVMMSLIESNIALKNYNLAKKLNNQALEDAKSNKIPLMELFFTILDAKINFFTGKPLEMTRSIITALLLAEKEQIISPFLDTGPPIGNILKKSLETSQLKENRKAYNFAIKIIFELKNIRKSRFDFGAFTGNQAYIAEQIIKHKTNKEIAELLGITIDGVKYHLKNMYSRIGVKSRKELVQYLDNL